MHSAPRFIPRESGCRERIGRRGLRGAAQEVSLSVQVYGLSIHLLHRSSADYPHAMVPGTMFYNPSNSRLSVRLGAQDLQSKELSLTVQVYGQSIQVSIEPFTFHHASWPRSRGCLCQQYAGSFHLASWPFVVSLCKLASIPRLLAARIRWQISSFHFSGFSQKLGI